VHDRIVWTIGAIAALAASGVAWVLRWLNARGLEVIDTDVPDHVPAYLVEMYGR
jgi:hypothetical protein